MPPVKQKTTKYGATLDKPTTLQLKRSNQDNMTNVQQARRSIYDATSTNSTNQHRRSMYDSTLAVNVGQHQQRISTHEHTHLAASTAATTKKGKKTKEDIIKAIITSEREYVENLDRLIKGFVRPLGDSSVTSKYRQVLFSNVKEIYSVHVTLQTDLEFKGKQEVGEVARKFVYNRDSLDVHSEYNHNLPKALSKLEGLKTQDSAAYRKITSGETPNFRIKELLNSVPNIIDTHIVHLEDLHKCIGDKGKDKEEVLKALNSMRDIAGQIKVKVSDLEMKEILVKKQNQISGVHWDKNYQLSAAFGRLAFEGGFSTKRKDMEIEKPKHGFLLDRMLIVTKPWAAKTENYIFEQAIDLSKVAVIVESRHHQVRLERPDGSGMIIIEESKKIGKWAEKLRESREKLLPKNYSDDDNHIFQLQTFPELIECDVCNNLLWGVYSQGYLCLKTGLRVHQKCLTRAERLPIDSKQGRVIDDITVILPQRVGNEDEERRQFFGGYFGNVDPLHIVRETAPRNNNENRKLLVSAVEEKLKLLKAGVLKGGFRYTTLDLRLANPTKPRCFIMWESKSEGTLEKDIAKRGFMEQLHRRLCTITDEIVLEDIQKICKEFHGQINTYTDKETGELFITGYYYENTDVDSSEDERESSNQHPYHYSGHMLPRVDSRHVASSSRANIVTKSTHHTKRSSLYNTAQGVRQESAHTYTPNHIRHTSRTGSLTSEKIYTGSVTSTNVIKQEGQAKSSVTRNERRKEK